MRRRRAFTVIELIITVGILVLLAALLIVALGGVRATANRAKSSGALRQMMLGHIAYSTDHEQKLMPGFVDAGRLQQLNLRTRLPSGAFIDSTVVNGDGIGDDGSYVWRLAPYLDDAWQTMFVDYGSPALDTQLDEEYRGMAAGTNVYGFGTVGQVPGGEGLGAGRLPAFGMNSIHVGGDNVHGPGAVVAANPWDNPSNSIAATRLAEVANPANLLVFAPTQYNPNEVDSFVPTPPVTEVIFGYAELRPPSINVGGSVFDQWGIGAGGILSVSFNGAGGIPVARRAKRGQELPVAHLDGSVTVEDTLKLATEPKFWEPFYTGP